MDNNWLTYSSKTKAQTKTKTNVKMADKETLAPAVLAGEEAGRKSDGAKLASATGGEEITRKPGFFRSIIPYHNDRFKNLKYSELCLNIFLWFFVAIQIAATQQALSVAPYSPVAALMVISCILFWVLAVIELVVFSVLTNRLIKAHLKDGHGFENKGWFRRFVLGRWSCIPRVLAFIGSVIMLFLITSFVFPESFYGTKQLEIYRIASVTHTDAAFFIRYPGDTITSSSVFVEYRVADSNNAFQPTSSVTLTPEGDFAGFVKANGLAPATTYEWKFNIEPVANARRFKTNPTPGTKSAFNFTFGSCFTYNFPYQLGATGFKHIEELNPAFLAFIGDFVYADVPVYRGDSLFDYRALYRQNFRNPTVGSALQKIPSYMMYDDHEIFNDYNQGDNGVFKDAIDNVWFNYVGKGNPVTPYTASNIYFFDVDYGDVSLFFLDLRYNRTDKDQTDGPNKSILGAYQKSILKQWLLTKNSTATFKFLVSPLFWTQEFPGVTDGWGGYLTERAEILNFISGNRISGVVFLSGDYHMPFAVELVRPGSGMYEFSASPVDAFDYRLGGYAPYANEDPFKPLSQRSERVLWYEIGPVGAVSFIGNIEVNTQAALPYITVSILDRVRVIYNITLTIDQLKPF
jgi:hypothetical protein